MSRKKRLLIAALDGVPYSLLQKFAEDGTMPNTAAILRAGKAVPMNSTMPDVSAVAWSTFMTGKSPAEHGIFGFVDIDHRSYAFTFPNSYDNQAETFWDMLGRQGKRCAVLNLPSTYPAKPINGILISGFPAVLLEKAVYPRSIVGKLQSAAYQLDVDTNKAHHDLNAFAADLFEVFGARVQVFRELWNMEPWDLFIGCITETDRLHHFFFDAAYDDKHPHHKMFRRFYGRLDSLLGEMFSWCDNDTTMMIVSDHGFTSIRQEFYINRWLVDNEFLRFRADRAESFAELADDSKAFALDPCRIFIHRTGSFSRGSVRTTEDYETIRNALMERLSGLEYNGEKVMKRVMKKEELYTVGPFFDRSADILCMPNDGFDLKASLRSGQQFGRTALQGMHKQDDAVLYVGGNGFPIDHKPNISEVAGSVLEHFNDG